MPNIVGGLLTEEAYENLSGEPNYWQIEVVYIETRDSPESTVLRQSPAAGLVVPGGSLITVEVAIPPEVVPVPSVLGLSEAEAKQVLAAAFFGVDVVVEANPDGGDSPPAGVVWAQTPEAGAEGEDILTITIFVNPTPTPPDEGDGDGGGDNDS